MHFRSRRTSCQRIVGSNRNDPGISNPPTAMTPWALLLLPLSSLALSDSVRFSPIHAFHPDPGTTSSLLVRTATEHPSSSSTVHPLSLPLRLVSKSIHRPAHPPSAPFARSARFRTQSSSSEWPEWSEVERPYPDLSHKETLVNLAILANDAYALPGSARWLEMEKYNVVRLTRGRSRAASPTLCCFLHRDRSLIPSSPSL